MSDTIIKVEGLGKRYTISHEQQAGYTALRDVISNKIKGITKTRNTDFVKKEDFWALKDISFEIKKGDAVGIIGRNGAGKSTLLKILSRITEPTHGRIELNGRVASLLEVGTGFHPELTGRENIFLNGAILGMSRVEIKRKFDEIVDFSGVEKFLDTPVKRYSSGMYVRLAFAVAAHLEPEILVVDEVLAVGDAEFQRKCLGKMDEVSKKEGRTVLFVSHNMAAISQLCNKSILLNHGTMQDFNLTQHIIEAYINSDETYNAEVTEENIKVSKQCSKAKFHAIRSLSKSRNLTTSFGTNEEVYVEIEYDILVENANVHVSIHVLDTMGTCVLATFPGPSASLEFDSFFGQSLKIGRYKSTCVIPANFLNDKTYQLNAFLCPPDLSDLGIAERVLSFTVTDTGEMRKEYTGGWAGVVRPKLAWQTEIIELS